MLSESSLLRIWYGGATPGFFLRFMALLFGLVARARRWCYATGFFRSVKVEVPIIVVGNITAGGTGKTPLVIALVDALRQRGWKPGVISRGFSGSETLTRVDANADPKLVGDEAALIFGRTAAPMVVARDRVAAAKSLIASGDVDVIVCDDGLQHYRLRRDVEVCVIDGQRRFGNGRLLPAGPLREPVQRLESVDFVVCNGNAPRENEIQMRTDATDVVSLLDSSRISLNELSGRRVHAVAGIGNPQRFFDTLRGAAIEIVEHPFPDHHAFVASDLEFGDSLPVVMTEKDAVKCRAFARPDRWMLPIDAVLPDSFFDAIDLRLRDRAVKTDIT